MKLRHFFSTVLLIAVGALQLLSAERQRERVVLSTNALPTRIHVYEDYETDIEKRWWLRGVVENTNVPPSASVSLSNTRACQATGTNGQKAVVFNPVPGPPMGANTRMSFRYWLSGTNQFQVQIFSLTREINRQLVLTNLEQKKWEAVTIDMTQLRQPDGGGGPLSADERIDDLQFYVSEKADLIIDDIILFEAAPEDEKRPFPRRIIFTAWFDTGRQGKEWPGDFEIVDHEKPLTWKAAKSVKTPDGNKSWIRLNMRGFRRLGEVNHVRFRYRITGDKALQVVLANSQAGRVKAEISDLKEDSWQEATAVFKEDPDMPFADEIQFRAGPGVQFLIDDVLLFEPAKTP